ncbi:MaoC family dehydratase [Croceicoccus naphthovorans]|uniref:Uncharacterized protein n=1 Tax=Croceicoccus naphthovorans TaxID=1348774 RepID=A0A0G3XEZ4_9SPHN|nr:MaoC family dehydratase [Croceicoccus naphthovorans]AKM10080.1 hypothetical protein AB433_08985 [Croceicoccus naphthovorans]MBB3991200.1 acyl dehydratase [Croceicoccus naphthovorans]
MRYYEDLTVGETASYGHYPITRDEVIEFASRYDPQDFHLDDKAAEAGFFGRLTGSGWMTCAVTMRMIADRFKDSQLQVCGGSGAEELAWKIPVNPGDTLTVRETLLGKRRSKSRPELGLRRTRFETLNQDGDVVLHMIVSDMVRTRDPDGTD